MSIESYIRKNIPAYRDIEFSLPVAFQQKSLTTNYIVTDYGEIENKILLLEQGVVQVSIMKVEEEKILEFVFPGEFFGAYTSFILHQPSDVQVMTLSTCEVSIIDRNELLKAATTSLLASHLSLCIAQRLFLSRARREKDFLTLSAEERYKVLLEKGSDVVKHIPGNKIAKYLGIQPESLSRIRRAIIP